MWTLLNCVAFFWTSRKAISLLRSSVFRDVIWTVSCVLPYVSQTRACTLQKSPRSFIYETGGQADRHLPCNFYVTHPRFVAQNYKM
jgi:hypothetical protein